jgi:7-carboxy-7-deazaguanine synthase
MSTPQPIALTNQEAVMNESTANLVEVFSAIQGEGINVGTRQLFIRFSGCDLRCSYCDSAHTWHPKQSCEIETEPGMRLFEIVDNPVTESQLLAWVKRLDQPHVHDSIGLTGGEPLLQGGFLREFLPKLTQVSDLPIYLETGGHHDQALDNLLPLIDLIGMDIKLPSVSGEEHWEAHQRFLIKTHSSGTNIFCKLIVSNQTTPEDLERAAALIESVDQAIACFLQPMTPIGIISTPSGSALSDAPDPAQVLKWQVLMKQKLKDVRVIPQTHKMIGQK